MPLNLPDVWGIKKDWRQLKTGDKVEIEDISPHSGYYSERDIYIGRQGIIDLDHNNDVIRVKVLPDFITCHIDIGEGFSRAFSAVKVKKVSP